ncbi:MAG: hypothetical protein HY726_22085 [Candidatus Rokubacteria bacterium]|nr:hypothetical protein [Candidatus Rokubacteria bacterium]
MLGPSGAVIIALALITAFALLVIAALGALPGAIRTVRRSFWCPFLDRGVTVEFQEEAWDGTPVGVNRCTAFAPPSAITCEKRCLQLKKFPAASQTAGAA